MWGRAHAQVRERVEHVGEIDDDVDPFAELQPVEKLKRAALIEHAGSVHQVVADPVPEPEPEPTRPSDNAKYWPRPRLNLSVARRFVAMMIMLSLFGGATGGMIVDLDLGQLIG